MISKLRCMKCKYETYVTDVFNMLSLSLPSNDNMKVSGYIIPYQFCAPIRNYDFNTTERLKYSEMLKSINKEIPNFTNDNYKMYFLLKSQVVGNFLF